MPSPMPVPPPVTSTTCPFSLTRSSSSGLPGGFHYEGRTVAAPRSDHESHGSLLTGYAALPELPGQRRQVSRLQAKRREPRLRKASADGGQLENQPSQRQLDERPVVRREAGGHPEQVPEALGRRSHVLDLAVHRHERE